MSHSKIYQEHLVRYNDVIEGGTKDIYVEPTGKEIIIDNKKQEISEQRNVTYFEHLQETTGKKIRILCKWNSQFGNQLNIFILGNQLQDNDLCSHIRFHFNESLFNWVHTYYVNQTIYVWCLSYNLEFHCLALNTSAEPLAFKTPFLNRHFNFNLSRFSINSIDKAFTINNQNILIVDESHNLFYISLFANYYNPICKEWKIPKESYFEGLTNVLNIGNQQIYEIKNSVINTVNYKTENNINLIITLHNNGKLRFWDPTSNQLIHKQDIFDGILNYGHTIENERIKLIEHPHLIHQFYLVFYNNTDKPAKFELYQVNLNKQGKVVHFNKIHEILCNRALPYENTYNKMIRLIDFDIALKTTNESNASPNTGMESFESDLNELEFTIWALWDTNNVRMVSYIKKTIQQTGLDIWTPVIRQDYEPYSDEQIKDNIISMENVQEIITDYLFNLNSFGEQVLRHALNNFINRYKLKLIDNNENLYYNIISAINELISKEEEGNNINSINNINNVNNVNGYHQVKGINNDLKGEIWYKYLTYCKQSKSLLHQPIKLFSTKSKPKILYLDGYGEFSLIDTIQFITNQIYFKSISNQYSIYYNNWLSIPSRLTTDDQSFTLSIHQTNMDVNLYSKMLETVYKFININKILALESTLVTLFTKNVELNKQFIDKLYSDIFEGVEIDILQMELMSISSSINQLDIKEALLDHIYFTSYQLEETQLIQEKNIFNLSILNSKVYSQFQCTSVLSNLCLILCLIANKTSKVKEDMKLNDSIIYDILRKSINLNGLFQLFTKPLKSFQPFKSNNNESDELDIFEGISIINDGDIDFKVEKVSTQTLFFEFFKTYQYKVNEPFLFDSKAFIKSILECFKHQRDPNMTGFLLGLFKYLNDHNLLGQSLFLAMLEGTTFSINFIKGKIYHNRKEYEKSLQYFKSAMSLYHEHYPIGRKDALISGLILEFLPNFSDGLNTSDFFFLLAQKHYKSLDYKTALMTINYAISIFLLDNELDEELHYQSQNKYYYFLFRTYLQLNQFDLAYNTIASIPDDMVKMECTELLVIQMVSFGKDINTFNFIGYEHQIQHLLWDLIYQNIHLEPIEKVEQRFFMLFNFFILRKDYEQAANTMFHFIIHLWSSITSFPRAINSILKTLENTFNLLISSIENDNLNLLIKLEFIKKYEEFMLPYLDSKDIISSTRIVNYNMIMKYFALVNSTIELNNTTIHVNSNNILNYDQALDAFCKNQNYEQAFLLSFIFNKDLKVLFQNLINRYIEVCDSKEPNLEERSKIRNVLIEYLSKAKDFNYYKMFLEAILEHNIEEDKQIWDLIINELYISDINGVMKLLLKYSYLELALNLMIRRLQEYHNDIFEPYNKHVFPIKSLQILRESLLLTSDPELINLFNDKVFKSIDAKMDLFNSMKPK